MNVLFYPTNSGDYLRMQVRFNGGTLNFNVGYKIDRSRWSAETQRCKKNTTHYGVFACDINARIEEYEKIIVEIIKTHRNASKDEIRHLFNIAIGKEQRPTDDLRQLTDNFADEVSALHSWSAGTLRKWRTIQKRLEENNFTCIEDINDDKLSTYVRNLMQKGQKNSSIHRELRFLFTFFRWLKRKGKYDGKIFETFDIRMKKAEGEIVFLTLDELLKLYTFDFSEGRLAHIRDVFCFLCFSGLRFSDLQKLKKTDVKNGRMYVTTQKTSEAIEVELNKYTAEILERYADNPTEFAIPTISNQKTNEALKEVGKIVGFDEQVRKVWYVGGDRHEQTFRKYEVLSTHAGRRTFVVNALFLGIPERVIRSWTGHSDARSMTPYVKIVEELKRNEMSKFDDLPSKLPSKSAEAK